MEGQKRDISSKSIKRAIALFFALLAMFTLLSPFSVHLNLWGAAFFYAFGLPFMWVIVPLFAVLCLYIFKKGAFPRFLWRYIIGVIVLALGSAALLSHLAFPSAAPFAFGTYKEAFHAISSYSLLFLSSSIGGGALGFLLSSLFSPLGGAFLYFICVLLFLVGLVVIFFPLLKKLYRKIRSHMAIAKSKKAAEKERKRLEKEEEERQRRIEAIAPIDEEVTPLPKREESAYKEETPNDFNETYRNDAPFRTDERTAKEKAYEPYGASSIGTEPEETIIEDTPKRVDLYRDEPEIQTPIFGEAIDYVSAPLSSLIDVGPKEAVYVPDAAFLAKNQQNMGTQGMTTNINKETIKEATPSFSFTGAENKASQDISSNQVVIASSGTPVSSRESVVIPAPTSSPSREVIAAPISVPEHVETVNEVTPYAAPVIIQQEEPLIERKEAENERINEEIPAETSSSFVTPINEEMPQKSAQTSDIAFVTEKRNETIEPLFAEIKEEEKEVPAEEDVAEKVETKPVDPTIDPLTGEKYAPIYPSYNYPDESLLNEVATIDVYEKQKQDCEAKKATIDQTLIGFKAGAHVESYTIGPSVTRFNIATDTGVTVSSVKRFIPNIQVKLGGIPTRYEEVVIGQMTSGLEIVNEEARTVYMKEIYHALPPLSQKTRLYIPFGEDISGKFISGDLSKFPHMLVSGGTGSGKSVYMHSVIMSLIMRNRPEELKLVMIDPKRVEMGCYAEIPHLLCPIVKEMSQAKVCVDKLCHEMERRYSLFEKTGTREINEYNNTYATEHNISKLPFIVCIIDEFADLMDTFKNVEDPVVRIAQKARAAGIHLIIATQRPTVNVVTGRLKANLGVRVALSMNSSTDSVTILNQAGAEELAGHGDMLVICPEVLRNGLIRAQGAMVETNEIRRVCDFIKSESKPQYDPYFLDLVEKEEEPPVSNTPMAPLSRVEMRKAASDDLYEELKERTMTQEYMSISRIQRELSVGFSRAGKLFKRLQEDGIVESGNGPTNSKGSRVLIHSSSKESSLPSGSTDNSDFHGDVS